MKPTPEIASIPSHLANDIATKALGENSKRSGPGAIAVELDRAMDDSGWWIPPSAVVHYSDDLTVDSLAKWISCHAVREKAPGRPSKLAGGKRVNVYLDAASLGRAAELGGGNVSDGIRRALATGSPPESH